MIRKTNHNHFALHLQPDPSVVQMLLFLGYECVSKVCQLRVHGYFHCGRRFKGLCSRIQELHQRKVRQDKWPGRGTGGGATPLYGLYRYVQPQRVGFSAVLVRNRVSIFAL